jgi:hypothetical protein
MLLWGSKLYIINQLCEITCKIIKTDYPNIILLDNSQDPSWAHWLSFFIKRSFSNSTVHVLRVIDVEAVAHLPAMVGDVKAFYKYDSVQKIAYSTLSPHMWFFTCGSGPLLCMAGLLVPPGWLQVTCVSHCFICQSKNVGKYLWHMGGIQIRSENLIVGAWYFMRHYWVLTICQKLPSHLRLHNGN